MQRSMVPPAVLQLREVLGPEKIYVVGGILRDAIAAQPDANELASVHGGDWDLATSLRPRDVMQRLRSAGITAIPVGFEHGTVAAVIDKVQYEITTFRFDLDYADGRHPVVRFADSLEDDLQRRDFTFNAFAMDVDTGEIIDRFDGVADLRAGLVRTVGDAEERFREDYLRMLRAVRFAAKLQGTLDAAAFAAIQRNAHLIQRISAERVRDELIKMLAYEKPSHGFCLMHQCGLLRYVLPELEMGFDVGQNRFHADDVAMHTLHAVDAAPKEEINVRWSLLMHDLGKTPCKQYLKRKGDYVFYGHQYASKRMARRIMQRLRFSNKAIEDALSVVENHMYNLQPGLSDGAIRRFVRKLGRERISGFLRLRMADRRGNHLNNDGYEEGLFHFVRRMRHIERADDALKITDLKINGRDLQELGMAPGPAYGVILDRLMESVLDDPALNQREWLLQHARETIDEIRSGKLPVTRIPRPSSDNKIDDSA
ncbi:MAG: HD domain-containing protein [Candidatus Hinthialibacter antarcticus]|nr:HD domain-containing protein [Candidatus Hinthialibacter antarcticus]